jgi:riboflavin kinase/FMN adenylyltransferase
MRILRSIEELSSLKGPIVLAVGTFDGLHRGHQSLIHRAMNEAEATGGTAVVMTFDRHPASIVRPERVPKLLTTNETKISLLRGMNVPALLLLDFTPELSRILARDFIDSLISASNPLSMICVGTEWSYGRGGEGNVSMLQLLGEKSGFSVTRIDPVEADGQVISSTRIRNAIAEGDFEQATLCLGRPWRLTGQVVTGAGLGTTIGFPTANLAVLGMQLPPDGVYAVRVECEGQSMSGICNIGFRPTVDSGANRIVEVHLFNVSKDFVGKNLSLEFVKFLRNERKFPNLADLQSQITLDCQTALGVLA